MSHALCCVRGDREATPRTHPSSSMLAIVRRLVANGAPKRRHTDSGLQAIRSSWSRQTLNRRTNQKGDVQGWQFESKSAKTWKTCTRMSTHHPFDSCRASCRDSYLPTIHLTYHASSHFHSAPLRTHVVKDRCIGPSSRNHFPFESPPLKMHLAMTRSRFPSEWFRSRAHQVKWRRAGCLGHPNRFVL